MYMTTEDVKGWVASAKDKAEGFIKGFNFSSEHVTELGVAAALGFALGFFIKKFGRPVIVLFIFMMLGVLVLQHADVVIVDWAKIKNFIGIAPVVPFNAVAESWYVWVKEHAEVVVSGTVGFLIGYKIG